MRDIVVSMGIILDMSYNLAELIAFKQERYLLPYKALSFGFFS